jgi:predicted RNA-binding Zn ribbon-like protein
MLTDDLEDRARARKMAGQRRRQGTDPELRHVLEVRCANDQCHLFLIDRSNAGTARWCSTAICGNRMKARRHRRKARATAG